MNPFIKRTIYSPRWQWLRPVLEYFFAEGSNKTQWMRQVMNRETEAWVQAQNPSALDVLELSGDNWKREGLFKSYTAAGYPEFDICENTLPGTFDLIIAEQVFEHLLWPYRAMKNIHKMLRPGGSALITVPFLIKFHPDPIDCSRWSELGLKHFMAECGFPLEQITTGSWGNLACAQANLHSFVPFRSWRHSLKNEVEYPVVVWAMARKSE
jgi:SAM-dependent methyltransferase